MPRYIKQPQEQPQRETVKPYQILSGGLPGSTVIRVGGDQNVKISGIDRAISVTTESTSIVMGKVSETGETGFIMREGTLGRLLATSRDGQFSLRISQAGKEVATATDEELIFNSDRNLFKIIDTKTGKVTVSWVGASPGPIQTFTKTIAHGQSNTPAILAFANDPTEAAGTYRPLPYDVVAYDGVARMGIAARMTYSVNQVDLKFTVQTTTNLVNGDWPFRYYILQETAR